MEDMPCLLYTSFWEFVYVDRGEILVTAGKLEYVLKAGEMAFHSCNEFHSQRSLKGSTADIIVVSFICTSPFMDDFKEKILFLNQAEKQCLHNVVRESEISYEAFEKAPPLIHMQKKASAPFGSDQLLKMGLEQLLILIYRRGESIGVQERQYRPSELSSRTLTVEDVYKRQFYTFALWVYIVEQRELFPRPVRGMCYGVPCGYMFTLRQKPFCCHSRPGIAFGECFRIGNAALQPAVFGTGSHKIQEINLVMLHHPFNL